MVVQNYKLSTWEAEIRGSNIQGCLGLCRSDVGPNKLVSKQVSKQVNRQQIGDISCIHT